MTTPHKRPFGSWSSPLTTEKITAQSVRLGNAQFYDGALYWTEGRPDEEGRTALCRLNADGTQEDIFAMPWNLRTQVHEYGGKAFAISEEGVLFSNFADQRLYKGQIDEEPQALTPDNGERYADPISDPKRGGWITVHEVHSTEGSEPTNQLVRVSKSGQVTPLVEGADFYASPALSPDGEELAWIEWDHPYMPWDSARLMRGDLDEDGEMISARCVAGGANEAAFQPQWSTDGTLYFISDPNGWWNLYRDGDEGVEEVWVEEVEMGLPLWVFGMSTYAFVNEEVIALAFCHKGKWSLATVDLISKEVTKHDLPFTEVHQVRAENDRIAILAGSPEMPSSLVLLEGTTGTWEVIRSSVNLDIEPSWLSPGMPVTYPTQDGAEAHGFYYAPKNPLFEGMEGEKPPLIVLTHGGPTASTASSLNPRIQFWTTRGFAILDVNYRGSTGYGRDYRDALLGNWGHHDVEDCSAGALFLVEKGWADETRLAIRGGSAGGYTTLAALTFRDVFHVGASYYGVSDIEALDADTHKFESRYTQRLIAPLPEGREIFHARSPIHHADQLACPVIFLQGLDDAVVPPNQSEAMVDVLKKKGIPVAYVEFEGEGHGFRKAENIRRSIHAEFAFYAHVFGFIPAEPLPPLTIHQ